MHRYIWLLKTLTPGSKTTHPASTHYARGNRVLLIILVKCSSIRLCEWLEICGATFFRHDADDRSCRVVRKCAQESVEATAGIIYSRAKINFTFVATKPTTTICKLCFGGGGTPRYTPVSLLRQTSGSISVRLRNLPSQYLPHITRIDLN
jgi:hypothetical protein